MHRFIAIVLPCVMTLVPPAGASAPARAEDPEEESAVAPPEEDAGRLRGTGMLILDPRDDPDDAKERLREFLREIQPHIPGHSHQEANRRQLEALLAADWTRPETLPELSFVFHQDMTAGTLHRLLLETPTGKTSEAHCRSACALEKVFDEEGVHVHLTRPFGGPGDTVLAVEFYPSEGPEGISGRTRDAEVLEFRQHLRDHWKEFGYAREPAGRIFGVRVVVGGPKVGEEWLPPE